MGINDQTKRQVFQSEAEKSQARESGFGSISSARHNRPFKDNTQYYYQLSSFVKNADHVNESKSSESKLKSLWNESNQVNHRAEMNLTHGMSRTETYNRPSLSWSWSLVRLRTPLNHITIPLKMSPNE